MKKFKGYGDEMETLKSNNTLRSLLNMVSRSNASNDYNRIENNFLHAALHLNAMKSIVFPEDQVPDLPADVHRTKYPLVLSLLYVLTFHLP